ncbi:uncharacterized protein TNCV_1893561 [Trichonephila clavipes]|nr:uncharacterized protein TNCV_1893561 [Trichonephila clavipes]
MIRGYSSEELGTLVTHPPNDTLNPLHTYRQVLLDFTQDKLAILSLNCQRAHQTDFDDVILQNCTLLILAETWLDNDERVSIPNFDCCVQFNRPGHRAAGVAIYRKQLTCCDSSYGHYLSSNKWTGYC